MATEEAERMEALKRAYADIILNTAKEAAARVLASERKALKLEQELRTTKEEAIRMLLRLKQMFDQKTMEAEVASGNQKRRIVEVEAQLNEAEELILDLRAELKLVYDQLDEAKSKVVHPLPGDKPYCGNKIHEMKLPDSECSRSLSELETGRVASSTKSSPLDLSIQNQKFCTSHKSDSGNHILDNSVLASVTTKCKEPALRRDNCTQVFNAVDKECASDEFSSGDGPSSLIIAESNGQNAEVHKIPASRAKTIVMTMKLSEPKVAFPREMIDFPIKVCKKRGRSKRRARHFMPKIIACDVKSGEEQGTITESYVLDCAGHTESSANGGIFCRNGGESTVNENTVPNDTEIIKELEPANQIYNAKPPIHIDLIQNNTSDATKKASTSADGNRVLVFTYSRKKRKNQSLFSFCPDEDCLEESSKKKFRNQQDASPQQGSNLMDESGDGKQLEEIARQLISLSGEEVRRPSV